jgi:hypothetical protein
MIADLMKTMRPSSTTTRSTGCLQCIRQWRCFRRKPQQKVASVITRNARNARQSPGGEHEQHQDGGRGGFSSFESRQRNNLKEIATATATATTAVQQNISEPLLDRHHAGPSARVRRLNANASTVTDVLSVLDHAEDMSHSAEADTVWYDVRWVLEYQHGYGVFLQDCLVLSKTLAASVALHYVTRYGTFLCSPCVFRAHRKNDICLPCVKT